MGLGQAPVVCKELRVVEEWVPQVKEGHGWEGTGVALGVDKLEASG